MHQNACTMVDNQHVIESYNPTKPDGNFCVVILPKARIQEWAGSDHQKKENKWS